MALINGDLIDEPGKLLFPFFRLDETVIGNVAGKTKLGSPVAQLARQAFPSFIPQTDTNFFAQKVLKEQKFFFV
jgi:hypothetical protein